MYMYKMYIVCHQRVVVITFVVHVIDVGIICLIHFVQSTSCTKIWFKKSWHLINSNQRPFLIKKKSSRNYFSEFEIRENYLTFLHLEMSLERFQYMY